MITGLGEHKVKALGKGTVKLDFRVNGEFVKNVLKDSMTPEAKLYSAMANVH
jgi:hypothetical protein